MVIWEVLDGGLKYKIELKWSDITAIQAISREDGPSSLTLVVAKQPDFHKEGDSEPGKNTKWQSTTDFTGGQASIHRVHYLQCEKRLLTKHFTKLIQCSSHLNFLSKQPGIILDSLYFDTRFTTFEKPYNDLHQLNGKGSATTHFQNTRSSAFALDSMPCEAPSSSPEGIYCSEVDLRGPSNLDQTKLSGLRLSISLSNFNDLAEEMDSGNPSFSAERTEIQIILDDVEHVLLDEDIQFTIAYDENAIISKVKSFGKIVGLDPAEVLNPPVIEPDENLELDDDDDDLESNEGNRIEMDSMAAVEEEDSRDVYGSNPTSCMSRKDSFLDLAHHLPEITDLPPI